MNLIVLQYYGSADMDLIRLPRKTSKYIVLVPVP